MAGRSEIPAEFIRRILDAGHQARVRPLLRHSDPEIVGAVRAYANVISIAEQLWGPVSVADVVDSWELTHSRAQRSSLSAEEGREEGVKTSKSPSWPHGLGEPCTCENGIGCALVPYEKW